MTPRHSVSDYRRAGLPKAGVIQRAGIDRFELCRLYKVRHRCLGRRIITGDEHLDLAAFAAFGREKLGEDRVERLYDLGAWRKLLNLFCG